MSKHREEFDQRIQRAHARGPDDQGVEILNILEVLMAEIDDLTTEFEAYQQSVTAVFTAVDQALGDFAARVTEMTTELQNAGLDPVKAQTLATDITNARAAAQTELSKVAAADPGPLASGGTASGGTAATPSGGAVATGPTLYLTTNDPTTINVTSWPPATVETQEPTPRKLYTYALDTSPGEQNGASVPGWSVYTGPTQPVPTT